MAQNSLTFVSVSEKSRERVCITAMCRSLKVRLNGW